jgi:hypothetical protein
MIVPVQSPLVIRDRPRLASGVRPAAWAGQIALAILTGCASPPPPPAPTQTPVTPAPEPAGAPDPVAVCDALTLYGNAAASGLCKNLSPTSQMLWVCELTQDDPDVHTTFNLTEPLHVTVRTPPGMPTCEGRSNLGGTWTGMTAGALTIAAGEPTTVCGLDIQSWVTRLNGVPLSMVGMTTNPLCKAGFLAAQAAGTLTLSVAQSYLDMCSNQGCP